MQGNGGNLSLISGREIGSCLDRDIYIHINGIFHIKNDEWSRLKNEDNYHGADSYHGDRESSLGADAKRRVEPRVDNPVVN